MLLTRVRQAAAIGMLLLAGAAAWLGCDALAGITSGELAAGADASVDGTVGDAVAGDGAPGEGAVAETSSDADAGPVCPDGGLACDGGCVDPTKDEGNCGSCGAACSTGFNCAASVCGNWVVDMVAGDGHTCARLAHGDVYCWGNDVDGELGNDAGGASNTPTLIAGDVNNNAFRGVLFMSAGTAHNCALRNGGIECWGSDVYGQLGNGLVSADGGPLSDPVPTGVVGLGLGTGDLDHPTFLARGSEATHACAVNEAGVVCWGDNSIGELGHPAPDGGSDAGAAADSGVDRVCTGGVACAPLPSPVVPPIAGVFVAVGAYFSCAVDQAGAVWCWGKNNVGQLGNGARLNGGGPPTRVLLGDGGTPALSVAAGSGFACALMADGTVWCWGSNDSSQLGHDGGTGTDTCCNTPSCSPPSYCTGTPSPVEGITLATRVEVGCNHACAIAGKNGNVFCWGADVEGQLGFGNQTTAKPVIPLTNADGVTTGCHHTCAWKKGVAYCWGENTLRQLGNGTVNTNGPVPVIGLP